MRGPLIRVLDAVTEHNRLTLLLVLVVSGVVAAGVVTLLIVMLTMNSVAILVRNKYQQEAN